MIRASRRYTVTPTGKVYFTEQQEVERDHEIEEYWAGYDDRLAVENRVKRNQLLADSDWTQMNDSPLSDEAKTSWATYRTSLRDLTTHDNWPNLTDSDWPTEPS